MSNEISASEKQRVLDLRSRFWNQLSKRIQTVTANSPLDDALPNCLNFRIPDIDSVDLRSALPKIAMSTGSACNSSDQNPSHVLMAIGLDGAMARSSIRVGFGRFTTTEEIDEAAGMIAKAVQRLQSS
ncbi:aminotransferase class V-fold PLP-dependent enzyme [Arthrobacter sp. Hiyo1]|uniref:aminotransferase class V-fold PLP-dependent enzyme n=1 Tax=Arthrobacter sp. Hiyo1 TaxID=1588020 RepID=UPI00403FE4A3